ncbi:MAG: MBL fold metallo-hydrolase [Desulfuromonadales bacterium]|nr:MBL fold metallo-hydrolase [Desulfuromonadales bacterium]
MVNSVKLTIICENTVGRPLPLIGEHGFACLIDSPAGRLLFDTGRGLTLLHNLETLGIDPQSIDAVVLSHGHDDHTGGLLPLLQRTGPRPVFAHPGIFAERFFVKGEERRSVGLAVGRAELEAAGARFRYLDECSEIAGGLWFSGCIPRTSPDEAGDPCLVQEVSVGGKMMADPFEDDAALAVETSKGLVILLGCAHAGLINSVEHFRRQLGSRPLHAVIGGTHLGPAGEPQFIATLKYLASLETARIGVSHCTGQTRGALLYGRFPEQVFFASVGSVLEI